jgi:hypothetical protein
MNQGFCINATSTEGDVDGAEVIYFEPQSAPSGGFTSASFSGEYLGGSLTQYLSNNDTQVDTNVASGANTFASTYSLSGPNGSMLNQQLTGTYNVTESGSIAIAQSGNPVYARFMVSPSKVVYVTSGNGSVPLMLVESQSDAPKHH